MTESDKRMLEVKMGKLPHASNFRDLIVYRKARALALFTVHSPKESP
jgi:hypothetical protein